MECRIMASGVCLRGCHPGLRAMWSISWGLIVGDYLAEALIGGSDPIRLPIILYRRCFYPYPFGFRSFSQSIKVVSTRFLRLAKLSSVRMQRSLFRKIQRSFG